MLYALNNHEEKIQAQPKQKAICPFCKSPVVAKCGRIKIWHWAHESKTQCDDWYEPETEWHLAWKSMFPAECVEVNLGAHRADIVNKNGVIIELQHSTLSADEIQDRESFYGEELIWLLDGTVFAKRFWIGEVEQKDVIDTGNTFKKGRIAVGEEKPDENSKFRWKNLRKSWNFARNSIFIDFGSQGTPYKERYDFTDKKRIIDKWTNIDNIVKIEEFFEEPEEEFTQRNDWEFWRFEWAYNGVMQYLDRNHFINKYVA